MPFKKITFFIIILASIFVINSLIHSIFSLWQKNNLIEVAKQDLTKQEKENKELKKKLTAVTKPEFVEGEARNKLFMSKTGEGVIVMPKDYESQLSATKKKKVDTRPNWQQWLDLFF